MHDLEILMDDRPGELARMGDAVGAAGLSIEGGGVFVIEGRGVGHFLFRDGPGARDTLRAAGLTVVACREVVTLRLDQEQPGQLGKAARAMADAGVNIEVQYSDHHHQLVLLVDDRVRAEKVAREWALASWGGPGAGSR
jgi:hypothetical protein